MEKKKNDMTKTIPKTQGVEGPGMVGQNLFYNFDFLIFFSQLIERELVLQSNEQKLCGEDMIVRETDIFPNGTSPDPRKAEYLGSNRFNAPFLHLFSKSV